MDILLPCILVLSELLFPLFSKGMAIPVPFVLVITLIFLAFTIFSSAADTITQFQSLADGSTLVSKQGTFELGFFTPGTSPNRYLGIWYKKIPVRTYVWVANREHPTKHNSSMLSISREGNLALVTHTESVIWSANSTTKAISPILQLLDSGNLVLREENDNNPQNYLWQSFDYPTDTLLPGMKYGLDLKRGIKRRLSAWKNLSDPSPGDLTSSMELQNNLETVMFRRGSEKYYRTGPWNGIQFSDSTPSAQNPFMSGEKFVKTKDEVYYTYYIRESLIIRMVLEQSYGSRTYIWVEETQSWSSFHVLPRDICDHYNTCGPNRNCAMNETNSTCQCLIGFKPKSPQNLTEGCLRSKSWSCRKKKRDGFVKLSRMKVPDTSKSWVDGSLTLEQCRAKCFENCSCSAYANLDIKGGGSGCVIWFGDLLDLREVSEAGQDLYIRLDPSEKDAKDDHKIKVVVISVTVTISLILVMMLSIFSYIYWRKRQYRVRDKDDKGETEGLELPLFDLDTIAHATSDFSSDKKLGEGGFGPVYKGILANGQEIAVKKLSQRSRQGSREFKNEVLLCTKLQHRNLVKILGCCIEREEKLLIYEYMPNKCLDSFLFDSTQSKILDWFKRFQIIYGIARGLLYLHQDSRLRIVHRDIKASNILLDRDLNPKISDFGIARMFGGDEIEGKTRRVAGTYGYMAPEYAINGQFSIKSDIFSFGILLLEIVSGKKNRGLLYSTHGPTLIGHAWRLWKEGDPLEFLDPCLRDSCIEQEVLRCIHIGLLCVQQHPHDRPNMASVVVMLNNESAFPHPKEPGFFRERTSAEDQLSSGKQTPYSINEITATQLEPR